MQPMHHLQMFYKQAFITRGCHQVSWYKVWKRTLTCKWRSIMARFQVSICQPTSQVYQYYISAQSLGKIPNERSEFSKYLFITYFTVHNTPLPQWPQVCRGSLFIKSSQRHNVKNTPNHKYAKRLIEIIFQNTNSNQQEECV